MSDWESKFKTWAGSPSKTEEERSEMPHGALVLDAHGPDHCPETLTGEYWTDRKTTGTMTFTKRVAELMTRYEDAKKALLEKK